jgi:hypothetical protein
MIISHYEEGALASPEAQEVTDVVISFLLFIFKIATPFSFACAQ